MEKRNTEAVPQALLAITDFIAKIPEVSQVLEFRLEDDSLPVFCGIDESASTMLERAIIGGLKQYVLVSFSSVDEPQHVHECLLAKLHVNVTIVSTGMLADNALRTTAEVGCAIIRNLDGACFELPFTPDFPVNLRGWTHNAGDPLGEYQSTLEFTAPVVLRLNP